MLEVRQLGRGRIGIYLRFVHTPKTSILSTKRLDFILAKVTIANVPQITVGFLVPCFSSVGSSLKNKMSHNTRKPQATPIPNHAPKSFFAVNPWASQVAQCKDTTCQCRRFGFDPWVGMVPWRRKWQPAPVFLPGESHGQKSLEGCSHGVAKSQT